jgi:hypothetical protein
MAILIGACVLFFGAFPQSGGWGAQPEGTAAIPIFWLLLPSIIVSVLVFIGLTIRDLRHGKTRIY